MPATAPAAGDERSLLLGALGQARYLLRLTAHGLTDDQAHATPSAGSLSIGGLIAHSAAVERIWMNRLLQRGQDGTGLDDPTAAFARGDRQPLADSLAEYRDAAASTDAVVPGFADLGFAVPAHRRPQLFPVDDWSVRWVLQLLIVETSRHTGHADLIREALDGATALALMSAAEGWPEGTVAPWRP